MFVHRDGKSDRVPRSTDAPMDETQNVCVMNALQPAVPADDLHCRCVDRCLVREEERIWVFVL